MKDIPPQTIIGARVVPEPNAFRIQIGQTYPVVVVRVYFMHHRNYPLVFLSTFDLYQMGIHLITIFLGILPVMSFLVKTIASSSVGAPWCITIKRNTHKLAQGRFHTFVGRLTGEPSTGLVSRVWYFVVSIILVVDQRTKGVLPDAVQFTEKMLKVVVD